MDVSLPAQGGESSGGDGGFNPLGQSAKTHPSEGVKGDDRLHKPGVAGSSPAAATLRFDEKISDYHSDKEWWSKSQLWDLHARGPLWFHGRHLAGTYTGPSGDSLRKGTLVHEWAEQGEDAWWARVAIVPEEFIGANGALLKAGHGWRDSLPEDAIVLKQDEVEAYSRQFAQLRDNRIFRALTEQTEHREFSIRWTCDQSGLNVRCRPDAATETTLWDLKTTKEASPLKTFHKSVHEYGYGFQAAHYLRIARAAGFNAKQFVFVVTSTVAPYECHAVVLPPAYLAQSERQVIDTCRDLQSRLALDHWQPVEAGQITELWMPPWTMEEKKDAARQPSDRRE